MVFCLKNVQPLATSLFGKLPSEMPSCGGEDETNAKWADSIRFSSSPEGRVEKERWGMVIGAVTHTSTRKSVRSQVNVVNSGSTWVAAWMVPKLLKSSESCPVGLFVLKLPLCFSACNRNRMIFLRGCLVCVYVSGWIYPEFVNIQTAAYHCHLQKERTSYDTLDLMHGLCQSPHQSCLGPPVCLCWESPKARLTARSPFTRGTPIIVCTSRFSIGMHWLRQGVLSRSLPKIVSSGCCSSASALNALHFNLVKTHLKSRAKRQWREPTGRAASGCLAKVLQHISYIYSYIIYLYISIQIKIDIR